MLQDEFGNEIPIDSVPIDNLGFFEYEQELKIDSPLSIPIGGGRTSVHMILSYLPLSVFNKSSGQLFNITYEDQDVGKIYGIKESNKWVKYFTITTIPEKVKLTMVEDPTQNMVINQKFYEEREYFFNYNPLEALEKDEEYTKVMIDALAREDYEFTYKLTDFE
ncbi:unnamed protein product, partial [marine sediment metagenome]